MLKPVLITSLSKAERNIVCSQHSDEESIEIETDESLTDLSTPKDIVFFYAYQFLAFPNERIRNTIPKDIFDHLREVATTRELIAEEVFVLLVAGIATNQPDFEECQPESLMGKIFICPREPVFENFHYIPRSNRATESRTSRPALKINQKVRIRGRYRYIQLSNGIELQERVYWLEQRSSFQKWHYLVHFHGVTASNSSSVSSNSEPLYEEGKGRNEDERKKQTAKEVKSNSLSMESDLGSRKEMIEKEREVKRGGKKRKFMDNDQLERKVEKELHNNINEEKESVKKKKKQHPTPTNTPENITTTTIKQERKTGRKTKN